MIQSQLYINYLSNNAFKSFSSLSWTWQQQKNPLVPDQVFIQKHHCLFIYLYLLYFFFSLYFFFNFNFANVFLSCLYIYSICYSTILVLFISNFLLSTLLLQYCKFPHCGTNKKGISFIFVICLNVIVNDSYPQLSLWSINTGLLLLLLLLLLQLFWTCIAQLLKYHQLWICGVLMSFFKRPISDCFTDHTMERSYSEYNTKLQVCIY